jgi:ABC-type Fe3+/spermidine/putrescine transport system ATPase subunit
VSRVGEGARGFGDGVASAGPAPILRVRGLEAGFGAAPGLAGVNFEVGAGETLGIVGPSGAGKTTLLRALAGLTPVQQGVIEVDGVDVALLPPERRRIVYLHQQPVLFPHLSVGRNVDFPMRLRGMPAAARSARVRALVEAVELGGFEDRSPASLSGGQRHRVALARAIAADPAVLLLDEPFAALDGALREEVRRAVDVLQRTHRFAALLVSHDLEDAGSAGNRIGVLMGGGIRQVGTLRELARAPGSPEVARFMGLRNELPGEVRAGGRFACALGEIEVRAVDRDRMPAPGPATAMFAPGAVRAVPDPEGVGVVAEVRIHAEGRTLRVRVGDHLLEARIPDEGHEAEGVRNLVPGDRVRVSADPVRVVVFGERG